MATISCWKLLSAAGVVSLAACVPPAPAPEIQARFHEDVLDHYVCYRLAAADPYSNPSLRLIDQFYVVPRFVTVTGPEYLCNPVRKEGSSIKHPAEHLYCYALKPQAAQFHATISNQLRTVRLSTRSERVLCLPTGKSVTAADPPEPDKPRVVDHFKCYTADPGSKFVTRRVRLRDQFGDVFRTVLGEALLCNPTEKVIDGEQYGHMLHFNAHLVCYTLGPEDPKPDVKAKVRNQFQPLAGVTVVVLPVLLCVPSAKSNVGAGP